MTNTISTRQNAVKTRQKAVKRKRQSAGERASTRRSSAGDEVSELVVHVFRLNGLLIALGDAMARPTGQTSARWRVLAAIDDRPLSVAEIARAWWLTRQSVQRVADMLVREGLVSYEDNPKHRRAKLVQITPRGLSALRAIRAQQVGWASSIGAKLGEADVRKANAVLAGMVREMTGE